MSLGSPSDTLTVIRERVATVLYHMIHDIEGNFDDSLFKDFLNMVSSRGQLDSNTFAYENLVQLYTIYKDDEEEDDGEDEPTINAKRLIEVHVMFRHRNQLACEMAWKLLDDLFLEILPSIVKRNNLDEVEQSLWLLADLPNDILFGHRGNIYLEMRHRSSSKDKENTQDDEIETYPIPNILELARYYILTSKDSNILEAAKSLLTYFLFSYEPSNDTTRLKQILEELIQVVKTPTIYAFFEHLFTEMSFDDELSLWIMALLQREFELACEQRAAPYEVHSLAKLMAVIEIPSEEILPIFLERDDLEGILTYTINANNLEYPTLNKFIIYPILLGCDSDKARNLREEVPMTRKEKHFIERNYDERQVSRCLNHISKRFEFIFTFEMFRMPKKVVHLISAVAVEYLRCHYNSNKARDNLIACCDILTKTRAQPDWLLCWLGVIIELADKTNLKNDPDRKPVFLKLTRVMGYFQYLLVASEADDELQLRTYCWNSMLRLVRRYTDPDVLCEFAYILDIAQMNILTNSDSKLELICQHMLPVARDNKHQGLTSILVFVLVSIDCETPSSVLDRFSIKRADTIPKLIVDLLKMCSSLHHLVRWIINTITPPDKNKIHYRDMEAFERVEFDRFGKRVAAFSENAPLDQLVKQVCLTVLSESFSNEAKLKTLHEINKLVRAFLSIETRPESLMERFVRNGILELLYELGTSPLYPDALHDLAVLEVSKIFEHALSKNPQDNVVRKLTELLLVGADMAASEDKSSLHERASEIFKFYEARPELRRDPSTIEDLATYIRAMLDQHRI